MKPKTLILMVVAVVCGLGASYMTSRLLAERDDKPAEAPPLEKVKLLVTKNNLAMHFALRAKPEDYFTEKEFVKDDAPKDALTKADADKLKGKFLKRSLRKGDHITSDDLIDGNPNLKNLSNGMRAVGIRVSPEQVASGFACVPGSHVDIHWTRRVSTDKDTFTKILLKDVIVLAADLASERNESGQAMLANVVTVALKDDDVMKLNLAAQLGSFVLVLRNLDDTSTSDNGTLTADQLFKSDSAAPKPLDPPVVAEAPTEKYERPDNLNNRGTPELPKTEPVKPAAPKLRKMTVTVRNNMDVQTRHYWVDENDNHVPNPQLYLEQWEQNGGAPSPGNKDDAKPKTLPKDV
jgi:pilus assembly protein CpaB